VLLRLDDSRDAVLCSYNTLFSGLLKGNSVPALRSTLFCAGVSSCRHSCSLCTTETCMDEHHYDARSC
jgi:hypothetical protein